MNLFEARNDISIRGKNGIAFLLSAVVIWSIITVIFLQPIEMSQKNIFMMFSTGLMFPLSLALSKLLNADWKFDDHELGVLGLFLNLAQIIYFPILFWAMIKSPYDAIMIFAVITGAHFFPYGWFYNAKPYYYAAPIIAMSMMFLGLYAAPDHLWLLPFFMTVLLLMLVISLYLDFRAAKKRM
ncbi:hypothetical protein SporoP37_00670 [Sporosarcina sp. P37]|uniref:DUF7010 family protein n=1 Tax=unclassified Sporosarcina TaxID=2647733 RepID=UPI000A17BF8F|nr:MULTISPECIES: hypothetical protein [unclassified Sporosarcina]ARK23347.1 hypothetical protein SporoP37_00670 [Sporosarcina sp. P37]PID19600.1 hypothetical protein CSV62_03625 [Sporosarcina sp. P35]